jgi:hypothetical protein
VDRRGGLAGELLVDDRSDESIEMTSLGARYEPALADPCDDARQRGIGGREVGDGVLVHALKISACLE